MFLSGDGSRLFAVQERNFRETKEKHYTETWMVHKSFAYRDRMFLGGMRDELMESFGITPPL